MPLVTDVYLCGNLILAGGWKFCLQYVAQRGSKKAAKSGMELISEADIYDSTAKRKPVTINVL